MLQSFFDSMSEDGRPEDEARRVHPLRRYGTPQDMANLVNWLAGDEARYATGQLWVLDGGLGADSADAGLSRRTAPVAEFRRSAQPAPADGERAGSEREGRRGRRTPQGAAVLGPMNDGSISALPHPNDIDP